MLDGLTAIAIATVITVVAIAATPVAAITAITTIAAVAIGALLSPIGARLLLRTNLQWRSKKNQEHA